MKRLIALVLLFALALAQGPEAFWKAVEVPGGVCADGSPYRFYVSPGDPRKVVIDFQGAGPAGTKPPAARKAAPTASGWTCRSFTSPRAFTTG